LEVVLLSEVCGEVSSFLSSNNLPSTRRIIALRLKLFIVFLGILLISGGVPLYAAVLGHIELKDGTLLKGKIFGMTNGVLRVRAAASMRNPIPIRWQEVTGLATEEAVTLVLDTGVTHEGRLQLVEPGSIQVLKDKNAVPVLIALESVKTIQDTNGGPAVSGESKDLDEIILKNGTRVLGTIKFMGQKKLRVKTTYADKLVIKWDEVDQMYSHEPLSVEVVEKDSDPDGDGFFETYRINSTSLQDNESFSLDRIESINLPDYRYKGGLDIGGNRTKGNSEATAINASTDGKFWTDRHRVFLTGRYAFASADGEDETKNARGALRYDYSFTKKIFSTADEFLEYDRFQGLDIRSSTSVGLGYQVFDMDSHHLSVAIGPGYVYQKFKEEGTTRTATFSWSLFWDYEIISDRLRIFHRQKGYRDLGGDGSTAVRWIAEQGARLELIGDLYFKLEFDYRFNSDPEPGRKKSDRAFIWALGYTFGN
jgi:putative salt-induced outer membrane protein YdiY